MKLAAILTAVAAFSAGAAQADAINIKIAKGDNQKLIVGPAFSPLVLRVLDAQGVGIGNALVTFTCTRAPAGPCIILPDGPFKTRSRLGGIAMLEPRDRATMPKTFEPGVETIRVETEGATSASFKVEFVADTSN